MALKYVQTLTLYQAGAGNIIGATSVVLTTLTDIYGNAITSMTPFGTKGYITLEPDTTNEEGATFTGITVNANSTTTLTGVSTILAQSPYTETSGLVRQHAGGSKVVVTDNVAFWNTFANINNDQTFAGANSFTQKVAVGAVTSSDLGKAATVDFVNATTVAGAPNASPTVKGIVQEATQAQVLAKTAAGSTGAELYVNPATLASTLLSDYKVDTGAANAYVITPVPAITAYTDGQIFSFKAVNANTTASTVNVNALGVKTIKKGAGATDLVANDIGAGMVVVVEYNATSGFFQMLNPVGNAPLVTTATTFNYQLFTTSGTWTKPSNLTGNELVTVQLWGGGGGGGGSASTQVGAGGGGGSYVQMLFRASDLGSTVTVTVATAAASGVAGGNTTFGTLATAYGGGFSAAGNAGYSGGGGGAGVLSVGNNGSTGNTAGGGSGGSPLGAAGSGSGANGPDGGFGGAAGGGANAGTGAAGNGGNAAYGGGGGGGSTNTSTGGNGGNSLYGGAGGAGASSGTNGTPGTSLYGGNGGAASNSATGSAGAAPGGGGGGGKNAGGAGGRGEVRVWVNYNPQ